MHSKRNRFFFLLVVLIGWGCDSSDQESNQDTSDTTSSVSASTSSEEIESSDMAGTMAGDVPYVVEDSSASITTSEGIKIFFISKGSGPTPTVDKNVLVHYHGMLVDGKVFDSSFLKGQPMDAPLRNLIKGWQIALSQVPTGSKVKLVIPPDLGYGSQGTSNIPPNSTLIFDIELISMY